MNGANGMAKLRPVGPSDGYPRSIIGNLITAPRHARSFVRPFFCLSRLFLRFSVHVCICVCICLSLTPPEQVGLQRHSHCGGNVARWTSSAVSRVAICRWHVWWALLLPLLLLLLRRRRRRRFLLLLLLFLQCLGDGDEVDACWQP